MAIAGVHDVPVIETTILGESQSSSSGHPRNQRRISTRASSMLQMWRELEDERAINHSNERGRLRLHQDNSDGLSNFEEEIGRGALGDLSESENGSVNNLEAQLGVLNEQEDRQSMTSEQSQDLGDVERERVRQIFREWMNSGVNAGRSNVLVDRSSRTQLLGENERERVRSVREWIQLTNQRRDALAGNREEHFRVVGSRNEHIRDGQVLDRNEGQAENSRREIMRLCGRQALLDLLAKKEQERRLELQQLEEGRPVSSFPHRNRIQSLLRIRGFQNTRSTESARLSSAAEIELGLLRQRQTVSGLREGFLSRSDSNVYVQASDLSGSRSEHHAGSLREDEMRDSGSNTLILDRAHEQNENNRADSPFDVNQLSGYSAGGTNLPELTVQVETRRSQALGNSEQSSQDAFTVLHSNASSDDEITMLNSEETSRAETVEFNNLRESHETFREEDDNERDEINIHRQTADVQVHASRDINDQESGMHTEDWQGQVTESDERESEGSILSNQWREDGPAETSRQSWPGDGEDSSHSEQNDAHEDYWHETGSQETPRDWMEMPSGPGATSSGRVDTYYFSDDDNLYNMEIRELLNRRTVSSLLHSGFRESLDQLIQSYVERQTHAPDDWELHEMLAPPFVERHQEQLVTHLSASGAGGGSHQVPRRPAPGSHRHWGHMMNNTNRSRNETRRYPGTEWETINDLRIDMARLQQRLNNMQKMLETCMDMQLELQRSVRQEVSAALNRSANQSELLERIIPKDSLKWDCIRKGTCCICSDSNIDSLLYRCGHMCTCTKCADVLIQGHGKCPICRAPVIEAIRAYFIQE